MILTFIGGDSEYFCDACASKVRPHEYQRVAVSLRTYGLCPSCKEAILKAARNEFHRIRSKCEAGEAIDELGIDVEK